MNQHILRNILPPSLTMLVSNPNHVILNDVGDPFPGQDLTYLNFVMAIRIREL